MTLPVNKLPHERVNLEKEHQMVCWRYSANDRLCSQHRNEQSAGECEGADSGVLASRSCWSTWEQTCCGY